MNEDSINFFGEASPGTPVPEPTTIILIGTGLAGLAGFRDLKSNGTKTYAKEENLV